MKAAGGRSSASAPSSSPGLYPVSVSYTPSGRTDRASVVASLTVTDRDFAVEYIELDPQTAALLAPDVVQAELAQRAVIFAGYTAQRLWSGSFQPPAGGTKSSIYGEGRSYNGGPVTDYHRGTDFIGDIGDLVFAAASGRIVFTGALQVRGNAIVIDHGAGVFTAYHHLSSIGVSEGQAVAVGQPIGAIGSTGLVTGPASALGSRYPRRRGRRRALARCPGDRAFRQGIPCTRVATARRRIVPDPV